MKTVACERLDIEIEGLGVDVAQFHGAEARGEPLVAALAFPRSAVLSSVGLGRRKSGEGGIRTLGPVSRTQHFQNAPNRFDNLFHHICLCRHLLLR